MSVDNFIPQEWAARILENLNDQHVYAALLNRDYEGDIRAAGDSVRINSIGRVTINSYTKNSNMAAAEEIIGADQVLIVDQQDYFNFQIDDIDMRQTKPKLMNEATREAGWGLADAADVYIAGELQTATAAAALQWNTLDQSIVTGTPSTNEENAYELLVKLGVMLNIQNVPRDGRWVVVPPFYEGALLMDDRFVSFGTSQNREDLLNGRVGRAAGFTVHISNNCPIDGSGTSVFAGYNGAATFAEQINDVEAYRPELRFADALKGLHTYGAKVTRPYALARQDVIDGT